MSLVKKDICKNISDKAQINIIESQKIFSFFLALVIEKSDNKIKITNFGTFFKHKTPERVGRNPKNKKKYVIKSFSSLRFKAASRLKNLIN